jgi:hypothetical protein
MTKKHIQKNLLKHVAVAPPAPVDNSPPAFLWGVLFLMIAILLFPVFFQSASEAKKEAIYKWEKEEELRQRELRWEREENEKRSRQREQNEKAEKEKMRLLEIEQERLAKIEYKKTRSAKEATKDSLSDFV